MPNNKNSISEQIGILDIISLGSAGLGVYNTILNEKQLSNDELFEKLILEVRTIIQEDNDRIFKEIKKIIQKENGDV